MRIRRFTPALCFSFLLGLLLVVPPAAEERAPTLRAAAEEQHRFADALAAFRAGEWNRAAEGFRSIAVHPGLLPDYAQFFLAESLSRAGDLSGARQVAESIAHRYPDSSLVPSALLLAAAMAAQQGDELAVESLLRRFLSEFGHRSEAARARYLLGRSLEVQGQGKEAARVFRELRLSTPGSGYDDAARDHLERLLRAGITLPPPTTGERLDRAERLLTAGMASAARDEAEALLAEGANPETALRALRVVAGAWRRLGRYDSAARSLERALAQAPVERRPGLLLELARVQERSGSWRPALGTAERLLRDDPAAREVPLALLLTGRIFEENGKLAEAATAYHRLAREFPGDETAGIAHWRLGWHAYLRGDLPTAAQRFGGLAELPAARQYRLSSAYWAGRSREKLGEHEEARRLYVAVIKEAPRSYYGLLAARRAGGVRMDPGNSSTVPLPADPLAPLAGDPRVARVAALRALGLAHFSAAELEQLLASSLDDLLRLYGVSAVYVKNEQYHLALRVLRRYFAELAESGNPALPRAFWEMFYPMGWQGELREAARRSGLDPNLVAAVVREESSFFPLARSRVGARGLMQLMPETARAMGIGQGELLDLPETNLRMGATFLAGLVKEFGDPRLAAAAYNAGPARVKKWWAVRKSDDVEAFVEQIPFDETRHFVKRVMVAWEEYRRIYGGDRMAGEAER